MQNRIKHVRETIRNRFKDLSKRSAPERARAVGPVVLVVLVLVISTVYLVNTAGANGQLMATGTIEATQVRLAPEISGRISEVLVEEGDRVGAGDVLLRLDDAILLNQRDQAVAGLAQAEAALAAAELGLEQAQQNYDDLFDNLDLATASALQEIANARDAVDNAQREVTNLAVPGKPIDIDSARAAVVLAREALEDAQDDYEPYANRPENNLTRANLQLRLAAAQDAYDDAVRRLNNLENPSNDLDLSVAEANLEVAQARLDQAETDYAAMDGGPDPDLLALAQGALDQAQAQLGAANANVAAAAAALASADLQIEKSVLTAPSDGTVLYRNAEPGEFAAPGTTLIVLAQLDDLTITVFLPEDRYGEVSLGDEAELSVDSFPDQIFQATVVRIADEAEFTPRNVQTGEGRRTTVFAIELQLAESSGMLKPGMPADVNFAH